MLLIAADYRIPLLKILNNLSRGFSFFEKWFIERFLLLINEQCLRFWSQVESIWVTIRRGVIERIEADRITYIEAADHYLKIHLDNNSNFLIKSALCEFYDQYLEGLGNFYSLSRSLVVNLDKIQKVENHHLYLKNGKCLQIPKGRREKFLERLMG